MDHVIPKRSLVYELAVGIETLALTFPPALNEIALIHQTV